MGEHNGVRISEEVIDGLRKENDALRAAAASVARHNDRLREIIEEMVDMIGAMIVIRDSPDVGAVRLASKAMLRNLQRLEDKLDEANSTHLQQPGGQHDSQLWRYRWSISGQ